MKSCLPTQKAVKATANTSLGTTKAYLDSNGRSEFVTPVFAAICGLFCTTLELRFRFMIPLKLGIFWTPFLNPSGA
jgi:hypothetical protein